MSPSGHTDPLLSPPVADVLPPVAQLMPPPAPAAHAPAGPSRRLFVTGVGALAAGAAAVGSFALPGAGRPASPEETPGTVPAGDIGPGLVVYVRPGESELTLMSGDREVVVDDPALARALARKLGA
ncbi:hypothetical protein [Jannaschia sp. R86511]|uniref:hypothetical protein n=1 Tax=Jannaschia sp. R86511 TaxID=3093853 RepID=UPI0036D3A09D